MTDLLNNPLVLYAIVTVIVTVTLANAVHIAKDSERFAVFIYGRFQKYKGPGLVLIATYVQTAVKLGIGAVGVKLSEEFVRFGDYDLPASGVEGLRDGDSIRIARFENEYPVFEESNIRPKQRCPNCSHEF